MVYSDRRGAQRKGSSSSSRSHRRPKRKHSGSSDTSHRKHRRHTEDRYSYDRAGRAGNAEESSKKEKRSSKGEDGPPSYDLSQARDAEKSDGGESGSPASIKKPMSVESRAVWGLTLLLPLLAATLLLFLITASSEDLRTDFAIVKISISQPTFDALYGLTQKQLNDENSALQQVKDMSGIGRRATSSGGFMTVGVWGWCVKTADSSKIGCSLSLGWFTMKRSLGSAAAGDIKAEDFNSFLTHCLLTHGLALLAAMMAIVPVGIFVYRRYYKNSEQVEGGWFQHGTILAALILALFAWIIDKFLLSSLRKKMDPAVVLTGPAVTLVGSAALCLCVSFLTSGVPVLGRFARYKYDFAKKWNNLEIASSTTVQPEELKVEEELEKTRRRKPGRRRRRLKDTMTRMFN